MKVGGGTAEEGGGEAAEVGWRHEGEEAEEAAGRTGATMEKTEADEGTQ